MKESIVAVLIIVAIILLCIYTTSFTSAFCNEVKHSVIECMMAAEQNDWNAAKEHIDNARESFDKKGSALKTFSSHREFIDINSGILKIDAAVKVKSQDVCISESNSLIGQLDTISKQDHLTLDNLL